MLLPVRCFTCNKVIGNLSKPYNKALEEGQRPEEIFKNLGLKRYCCRRMLLTDVDLTQSTSEYGELPVKVSRKAPHGASRIYKAI